ncbi:MAG: PilN domain-containing protein [Nitrospirae bacterium]|nr:PilN domain-containing protein [Nitrospirota bacterium]
MARRSKQRINLYRPVLGTGTIAAPKRSLVIGSMALLIVSIAVVAALDLKKRWELGRAIAAQQAERDQVKAQIATLSDRLTLLTSGMNAQVTTASAELLPLINQRTKWTELFQDMSLRVPEGVWLLKMDVETLNIPVGRGKTKLADKKSITLSGFARSFLGLGQLLMALEQSPKFTSVTLKSAKRKTDKLGEQVDFEIAGVLL